MTPAPYSVVPADLATDRASVIGLWKNGLGDPTLAEGRYKWFYENHPDGAAILMLLHGGANGVRVGVAGIATRRISVRGESLSAGALADFVVLGEHRTLMPALLLQKQMRHDGLLTHCFLYGNPNEKSVPVVRRLGYMHVGDMVRYAIVLRHHEYLRRWIRGWPATAVGGALDHVVPLYFRPHRGLARRNWHAEWVSVFDARFDSLWTRAKGFEGIIGVRDARFLSWRFTSQPGHAHRTFILSPKSRDEICGYAVCEAEGPRLHVRDLLVDPAQTDGVAILLHFLSRAARREGYSLLSLELMSGADTHRRLEAAGMTERERTPVYASFAADYADRLRNLEWHMTKADFDV